MSLGWITETTFTKRAAKEIAVNPSSIGELRSAYYGASEELRAHGIDKDAQKRFKANVTSSNVSAHGLGAANRGVVARGARDRAAEAGDTAHSQAVLKAKAKIYERISRGELPQESEEFLIDFQRKGWENIEMDGFNSTSDIHEPAAARATAADSLPAEPLGMVTDSMRREQLRKQWEATSMQEIEEDVLHTLKVAPRPSTGIRQKWEFTLSAEEKQYLAEIRNETIVQRRAVEEARRHRFDSTRDRRRLIREKEQRKRAFFQSLTQRFAAAPHVPVSGASS